MSEESKKGCKKKRRKSDRTFREAITARNKRRRAQAQAKRQDRKRAHLTAWATRHGLAHIPKDWLGKQIRLAVRELTAHREAA